MKNRKYIIIILIIICVLVALWIVVSNRNESTPTTDSNPTETVDTDTPEEDAVSLEKYLYVFEADGYKKSDDGYKLSSFDEDVSSERFISTEGNLLKVKLCYNYGNNQNNNMKKYFKEQDEAVNVMVSSFLSKVAYAAESDECKMAYEIYVANDLVVKDTMDVEEAEYYQSLAVE